MIQALGSAKFRLRRLCRLRWGWLLVAAAWSVPAVEAAEAIRLDYREQEVGQPSYPSRVWITQDFLRQDLGPDDSGFLLFDRAGGVVYSVDTAGRTILTVARRGAAVGDPPATLKLTQASRREPGAPTFNGVAPLFTDYRANGELCYRTVSVPGLLPDALAAWRELRAVMAAQRAATLANTPAEFLTPCVQANGVYAPLRYLEQGLPIREHSETGLSRELVGIKPSVAVDDALFALPEGFRRMSLGRPQ